MELLQQASGTGFGCCYDGHIIHIGSNRWKTQAAFGPLATHYPSGCPYDQLYHDECQRRNCAAYHHANFQMLPDGGISLSCDSELEILKIALDQFRYVVWYTKVIKGHPQELVRN